jgi:hypothetical protein
LLVAHWLEMFWCRTRKLVQGTWDQSTPSHAVNLTAALRRRGVFRIVINQSMRLNKQNDAVAIGGMFGSRVQNPQNTMSRKLVEIRASRLGGSALNAGLAQNNGRIRGS